MDLAPVRMCGHPTLCFRYSIRAVSRITARAVRGGLGGLGASGFVIRFTILVAREGPRQPGIGDSACCWFFFDFSLWLHVVRVAICLRAFL